MSNVTNLNKFRKDRARQERRTEADSNAVKFGRTKEQRLLEEAQGRQARERLEQHLRDTPET